MNRGRLASLSAISLAAAAALAPVTVGTSAAAGGEAGAVYAMTNDAAGNQVVAYVRGANGQLSLLGRFDTDGVGTGRTRLSSQGSVLLSQDNKWLFVTNVGSDELSVFAVLPSGGLRLVDVVASGGDMPNSVTVDGGLVYVLNNGGAGVGNITGFRQSRDGTLRRISQSTRPLAAPGTDPAEVSFSPDGATLVVTEKATNVIDTFAVGRNGRAAGPVAHPSAGVTPFGFDFTQAGEFVVTEATGGAIGAATASSYALTGPTSHDVRTISPAVPDQRSEVCWTVITEDERFAYVTNFGDGTISSYRVADDGAITLHDSIAATTTFGELSVRDHVLSDGGRYLYAIDISSQEVHGWVVKRNGDLTPLGTFEGLPRTVAGLAAS